MLPPTSSHLYCSSSFWFLVSLHFEDGGNNRYTCVQYTLTTSLYWCPPGNSLGGGGCFACGDRWEHKAQSVGSGWVCVFKPLEPTWKHTCRVWGNIFSFHKAEWGLVVSVLHVTMQKQNSACKKRAGVDSSFNPDCIEVLLMEMMLSLKDTWWNWVGR